MTQPSATITRVTPSMADRLQEYVRLAAEVLGTRLRSLVLWGSVLDDGFDPRRESADSVLVLQSIDLGDIRRLAEHGARLGKLSVAAPLVVTVEHIRSSLDSFPLEFIEITQRYVTLVGDDPIAGLPFADGDVRLQCEREVKVLLIGLRQGLLAAAGRQSLLPSLERAAARSLLRTLRGVLWLRGRKDFAPPGIVVEQVEAIAARKLDGVRAALHGAARPGWPEFEKLYQDVETVGELVRA